MAAWRNACVTLPRGRTEPAAAAATVKGRLAHMYERRISYERKETEKEREKKEKTVNKVHWHKIPNERERDIEKKKEINDDSSRAFTPLTLISAPFKVVAPRVILVHAVAGPCTAQPTTIIVFGFFFAALLLLFHYVGTANAHYTTGCPRRAKVVFTLRRQSNRLLFCFFPISTQPYRLGKNIFTENELRSFIPVKKKNTTNNVEETGNRVFCGYKSNARAGLRSISVIDIEIIHTCAVLYALECTLNDVSFKHQIGSH